MTEEQILSITGGSRIATADQRMVNIMRWHALQRERALAKEAAAVLGVDVKAYRELAKVERSKALKEARRFKARNQGLHATLSDIAKITIS